MRIGAAARAAAVVLLAASSPALATAQRYRLMDSTAVAMLSGEISGDAAYDHVRVLTSFPRPQGSDTLGVAARYVERLARQFGLQAIDGTRTGLDIYRLVAAEAREGGEHYYGVVRPDAVLALLRNVEQLGLVRR